MDESTAVKRRNEEGIKKVKVVGEDGIALEMIIALSDFGTNELSKIVSKIYDTCKVIVSL